MGIWLDSWVGDHAGQVVGRQRNRLLISLTHTDGHFPAGLHQVGDFQGTPWYFNFYVTCLTPGSRDAIATAITDVGDYVWSVELAEVDWGEGLAPWEPGVHLFSSMLLAPGGQQSGTIGTAVIDESVKRIRYEPPDPAPPWEFMAMRIRAGGLRPPKPGRVGGRVTDQY